VRSLAHSISKAAAWLSLPLAGEAYACVSIGSIGRDNEDVPLPLKPSIVLSSGVGMPAEKWTKPKAAPRVKHDAMVESARRLLKTVQDQTQEIAKKRSAIIVHDVALEARCHGRVLLKAVQDRTRKSPRRRQHSGWTLT
jgi:hypothetical protein